jgi:hypothetical protein
MSKIVKRSKHSGIGLIMEYDMESHSVNRMSHHDSPISKNSRKFDVSINLPVT